jgi:hypothetical protein
MSVDDAIRTSLEQLVQPVDTEAVLAQVAERHDHDRRRHVVARAVLVAAAVALLVLGALAAGRQQATPPTSVPVPPVGQARAERLADGTPVWVVHHDDGTATVLDAVSTHRPFGLGQLVGWCAASRSMVDPRYGSQYDEHGRVRAGPAPTGLGLYPSRPVTGGRVELTGPMRVQPRAQEGGIPAAPSTGPDCVSSRPSTLLLHEVTHTRVATLREATKDGNGALVVVRDAPILLRAGQVAVVCWDDTALLEADPPTCSGVQAPGVSLGPDLKWEVVSGTFLARVREHAVRDIVYLDRWQIRGPVSPPVTGG